jgi:hypothetical protein
MDQLQQAEEELSTPPPGSSKGCENLKEGLLAKKVIGVWMHNRRDRGSHGAARSHRHANHLCAP